MATGLVKQNVKQHIIVRSRATRGNSCKFKQSHRKQPPTGKLPNIVIRKSFKNSASWSLPIGLSEVAQQPPGSAFSTRAYSEALEEGESDSPLHEVVFGPGR